MKKAIKAIVLAAALVAMPVAAFAAGSTTAGGRSSSGNASGHGGGGSSTTYVGSSSTTVSTTTTVDTVTLTAANGSKVTVRGANTSGGITAGLVDNGSGATVAVGEAKCAGLPADTVAVIGQVDNGNLAGVPGVDTYGYQPYGGSIAVRAESGNVYTTLYVSSVPSGVVKILFYNNYTDQWTLIDATVDAENNLVNFIAPTSGTATIVG